MTQGQLLRLLRVHFLEAVSEKTSWDRNELVLVFDEAVREVLLFQAVFQFEKNVPEEGTTNG